MWPDRPALFAVFCGFEQIDGRREDRIASWVEFGIREVQRLIAAFEKTPDLQCGWHVGQAAVVFLPMALGKVHFEAIPNPDINLRAILFTLLLFFCGAAGEEMSFRGFPLQFLMRGYGPWISILGTGALFGAAHAINPNSSSLGIANTAGFGMLFGFALLRSRDLWFPIGMHFGWNAMLPFLGTELSGLTIRLAGYKLVWNAGDLWSGGSYGIEGSAVTTGILILLAVAVWKVPVHRGTLFLLDEDELASEEPPPSHAA